MKMRVILFLTVLANVANANLTLITFDVWPNGTPLIAPHDPELSLTNEFVDWGILFEPTSGVAWLEDATSPPNGLKLGYPGVLDGVTLDAQFVEPGNAGVLAVVPWVEIKQDWGAASGTNTFQAYDILGNLVDSIAFNTSGGTFRLEYSGGIHRVFAYGHDGLDDLKFGDVSVVPVPGAAVLGYLSLGTAAAVLRRHRKVL